MKVDFYRHSLTSADAEKIGRVLATPFITTGSVGRSVEAQLAAYFGTRYAALANSWTNGALAVLLAMDIGPGDEVVVPAATFISSANVVELTGAKTVFADVDPGTLLLTPATLAPALSARTRAVMPVHMYGQMCDMPGLRTLLDAQPGAKGRISLIEDCAHCFEGSRDGVKPGQIGDVAVFSFYATKNVTCGEGGAIITGDEDLNRRILEARLHGMSAIAVDRFQGGRYNAWDMMRLGTKANLPDLLAALLPDQIATIDQRLPDRTAIAERYRAEFADGPLRLVQQVPGCISAEHIFPIAIPGGRRDDAIHALNAQGVSVTVNYRSVPGTTYYRSRYGDLSSQYPVSLQWGLDTLTLPLFPSMTEAEQAHVVAAVKRVVYPLCS